MDTVVEQIHVESTRAIVERHKARYNGLVHIRSVHQTTAKWAHCILCCSAYQRLVALSDGDTGLTGTVEMFEIRRRESGSLTALSVALTLPVISSSVSLSARLAICLLAI